LGDAVYKCERQAKNFHPWLIKHAKHTAKNLSILTTLCEKTQTTALKEKIISPKRINAFFIAPHKKPEPVG